MFITLLNQAVFVEGQPSGQEYPSTFGIGLDAQGIEIHAYLATSYPYIPAGTDTDTLFDKEGNGFNLRVFDLSRAKLPAQGLGAFVHLKAGPQADVPAAG